MNILTHKLASSPVRGPKMMIPAAGYESTTIDSTRLDRVSLSKDDSKKILGQRVGAVAALTTQVGLRLSGLVGGALAGSVAGPIGMVVGASLGLLGANKALVAGQLDKRAAKAANTLTKAVVEHTNLKPMNPKAWERDLKSGVQVVDEKKFQEFVDNLQPGDMLVGSSESSLLFQSITAVTGVGAYNHGMLYSGDKMIVESVANNRLRNNGVREYSLEDKKESYSAWLAIRPDYSEGQNEKAVAFAQAQIGKQYDWPARMDNDLYGCAELVFDSVKAGAPDMGLKTERFFGLRDYVSPQGLLDVPGSNVVGELGVTRGLIPTYLARYGGEE